MKRIALLTTLLILGLVLSQVIPLLFGAIPEDVAHWIHLSMMGLLAYIMIEVGREFEIDFGNLKEYGVDFGVASTAATLPWLLCAAYFYFFLMPDTVSTSHALWVQALIAGAFAAPTSAGVLFSMLAAAGLAATWTFGKTRNLAIFDDLFTVLLLLPLSAIAVGLQWQLGVVVLITLALLIVGFRLYRKVDLPSTWPWLLLYSLILTAACELLRVSTLNPATEVAVEIEVLLPAFLFGLTLKHHAKEQIIIPGEDAPGTSVEEMVGLVVSCLFLLTVGLSMPAALGTGAVLEINMTLGQLIFHVVMIMIIANLGKCILIFFYQKESTLRQRVAASVAMFPRGEVGAGVLAIALGYGINGPFVTIAFLSLALNLALTGAYIWVVKWILRDEMVEAAPPAEVAVEAMA